MTILVTGATGHLGRLAVDALIARGAAPADIVAGARTPAKAADLTAKGVRVVELDYDKPETIAAALEGVERVLLISGSEVGRRLPQHTAVIEAAKAAGVAKLVYTSAPFATTSALLVNPEHKATEELIAASGIPAVVVRNNWYHENYTSSAQQAAATGALLGSVHEGRVASASRKDYAEGAAVAVLTDGNEGQVLELAGDVAWTRDELAAAIAEVTGKPVAVADVSTEEHAAALKDAGLDEGTVGFVTLLDADTARGDLAFTDGTLAALIGRPTTPLAQGLREDGLGRVE
jgi:NAD(P)H dehydrogenase (quinone)